jgi:chromosome partitioning protein
MYLVGKTKGGGGASTTVCHLAVMRAKTGKRLAVYDFDKQRSTHGFLSMRNGLENAPQPDIKVISAYLKLKPGEDPVPAGKALIKDLRAAAEEYDDVLIDCGGTDNPALRFAMLVADKMFVPLSPAMFDVWALDDLNTILSDISSSRTDDFRPVVFPNMVSHQTDERPTYHKLKGEYQSFDFAPDNVVLRHRAAFRRSLAEGKGVFDMDRPDPKARQELLGLYRLVFGEDWRKANG